MNINVVHMSPAMYVSAVTLQPGPCCTKLIPHTCNIILIIMSVE